MGRVARLLWGNRASDPESNVGPIDRLRYWYEADTPPAHRFRYGLLAFDIVTIVFVVASSFFRETWWVETLDVVFGLAILVDFAARLVISRERGRDLLHPATWADVVSILSFLAPLAGEAGGFLRVLRTLRLLHTYQITASGFAATRSWSSLWCTSWSSCLS